jgi:hypothetical protein
VNLTKEIAGLGALNLQFEFCGCLDVCMFGCQQGVACNFLRGSTCCRGLYLVTLCAFYLCVGVVLGAPGVICLCNLLMLGFSQAW